MNVAEEIKKKFRDKAKIFQKSEKRIYVDVPLHQSKEMVGYLFRTLGARLSTASGVDTRTGIEIMYHMAFDKHGLMVTVRTSVDKPDLKMASVTDVVPAANWVEREIHEMLGVDFTGHPNLERLLLPDDWQEGEYPFRKRSFDSEIENTERA